MGYSIGSQPRGRVPLGVLDWYQSSGHLGTFVLVG